MSRRRLIGLLAVCSLGSAGQRWQIPLDRASIEVWGRGSERPRVYFEEWMPALFERTLRLDEPLAAGVALEWILTGPRGGVTITVTRNLVTAAQRYYDSFGHSASNPPKARYPEREWSRMEIAAENPVREVTVVLDHKLELEIRAGGTSKRETCVLDLQRSQLLARAPAEAAGVISGELASPPRREAALRTDESRVHQTMLGFGGIVSAPAFRMLSEEGRRRWFELLDEFNLKLHREYPNGERLNREMSNFARLADAVPHYYGDNFPNGEVTDFDYIREARKRGSKVVFEFWQLPAWARQAKAPSEEWLAKGGAAIPERYVEAMMGYVRESVRRTGTAPEIVGVQNEITQPADVWRGMILGLRAALDREGFKHVRIHMPDASTLAMGIESANTLRASPEVWAALDYSATHVYDFQRFFQKPDEYDARIAAWRAAAAGKSYLATEFAVNSSAWQSDSYRVAFSMGQLFHKNLALMDAQALMWCWTLLDVEQPSFAATRALFEPDRSNGFMPRETGPITRVYGAFSRRIQEGMKRIETASNDPDLLVTAYRGGNGEKAAVLLNRGTATVFVRGLEGYGKVERTSQYLRGRAESCPGSIVLDPGELATLTGGGR